MYVRARFIIIYCRLSGAVFLMRNKLHRLLQTKERRTKEPKKNEIKTKIHACAFIHRLNLNEKKDKNILIEPIKLK